MITIFSENETLSEAFNILEDKMETRIYDVRQEEEYLMKVYVLVNGKPISMVKKHLRAQVSSIKVKLQTQCGNRSSIHTEILMHQRKKTE